jgi:hypothetical protein
MDGDIALLDNTDHDLRLSLSLFEHGNTMTNHVYLVDDDEVRNAFEPLETVDWNVRSFASPRNIPDASGRPTPGCSNPHQNARDFGLNCSSHRSCVMAHGDHQRTWRYRVARVPQWCN